MDAVIVIIGGMGPMAGAECFKYVTSNSNTNGTDQSNLDVMLVSFPSRIVNRVDFVLGRTDINPATSVLEFIKPQFQALSTSYKRILVGIPCITFHCPCCFSCFEMRYEASFRRSRLLASLHRQSRLWTVTSRKSTALASCPLMAHATRNRLSRSLKHTTLRSCT